MAKINKVQKGTVTLHLTMQTLGVAFEFVENDASVDFLRRALICLSYPKREKASGF